MDAEQAKKTIDVLERENAALRAHLATAADDVEKMKMKGNDEELILALECALSNEVQDRKRLQAEIEALERERDALIEACIKETWRRPFRTLLNAEDSGVMEHGWEWRVKAMGDFVATRAVAIAAVRRAAGLEVES